MTTQPLYTAITENLRIEDSGMCAVGVLRSPSFRFSGVVLNDGLPCHRFAFVPIQRIRRVCAPPRFDDLRKLLNPELIIIRREIVQLWTLVPMDSAKAIILADFGVSTEEWIQFQADIQLGKRVRHVASFWSSAR
jgi:hypothetical protein